MTAKRALARFLTILIRNQSETCPLDVANALPDSLIRHQRLAPLAYTLGIVRFKKDYVQNALLAEQRRRVFDEILSALVAVSVDVCRLKGSAYIVDLYTDPAERPMGDLDILVRPQDMKRAVSKLMSLGFSPRSGQPMMFAPTHHALTLDREGVSVDVHRNMTQAWRSRIDVPGLWRRANLVTHRLEPVDEVVLHLSHLLRHEFTVPLSAFVDLSRLLRVVDDDRAAVLARADAYRVGRGSRIGLAMLDVLSTGRLHEWPVRYPLPSADTIFAGIHLPRVRQLLAKGILVDGPKEFFGLALVTLLERGRVLLR